MFLAGLKKIVTEEKDNDIESIKSLLPKDKQFTISISYKDCTGCGLCVQNCPGKLNNKALKMEKYDKNSHNQETFNFLINNNVNNSANKNILNVKNLGFIAPDFEFSGACAGCGETPYIKNLTSVFKDNIVIANATGCSSIYGASVPSTPYSIPWANSLFEDNAEYGLGIKTGFDINRNKVKLYMEENINDSICTEWLENMNDFNVCKTIKEKIDYIKHPFLLEYKEYITPKSIWIIGGDGFAYDIGFGGLDHVLSTNNNINILILDTEVYSNTGGQSSKSSNLGSIASFTKSGKTTYKKDLARIAMCYPNAYVACTNIGYDKEQYLKVLKEANLHNGPSLVIAYAPCIEHGLKTGMEHSLDNANLATKCGYFLTFRYNSETKKFNLDSKDVDFNKYNEFLNTENRFSTLKNINPDESENLLNNQKEWAKSRFEYYKNLEN